MMIKSVVSSSNLSLMASYSCRGIIVRYPDIGNLSANKILERSQCGEEHQKDDIDREKLGPDEVGFKRADGASLSTISVVSVEARVD
ncbi:hypothetical protein SISSUDRAFT_1047351 [Sistotremastrum suecicum HHB10207 ss-3]|uniref:Uncharacterized protein n=1 Tax=Sistotremastrum suecicum HHB10207 ss-3 TaxID=1314776 RepID=A0A166D876_9AGAM|nr:hypothetical protein SISSUDRAFT_1047351 [Sistotremastrum suecicum HHB10207 ss-3]